jgi:triphosphatase
VAAGLQFLINRAGPGMEEVEIKLQLERGRRRALLRAACLRASQPFETPFLALYFDTADADLARDGMSLRLRREGDGWKQTLKTRGSTTGGVHERDEWEHDAEGPVLDLARFRETPLAGLPHAHRLHETLVETFRVEVKRTLWNVGRGARRVEVVLDEGEVRAATGRAPILEVEIESKGRDTSAVFDIAACLVEAAPMRPGTITKAQRGYRLLHPEPLVPVRAADVELGPKCPPAQAVRIAVTEALRQLQGNEEGVLESNDPEFVHQLRVALRRMRSALRAHRRALETGVDHGLEPGLRWITSVAGAARDMDVLADQTLPAMAREGAPLGNALRSKRYALLVLALARWLRSPAEHAPRRRGDLRKFAAKAIQRAYRKTLAAGHDVEGLDAEGRHRLRIEAKKLRYAIQGFASLWPEDKAAAFLDVLSTLQDDLGRANDAAVATRLLEALGAPEELAAFARGWLGGETTVSTEPLGAHLEALARAPRFWKG